MERLVLDASVVAKFFLHEEESDTALEIKAAYISGDFEILAPSLIIYEIINLFKYRGFSAAEIRQVLLAIHNYGFSIVEIDNQLADKIVELCIKHDVTAYDASYIAVALVENAVFFTADKKLVNRFKGSDLVLHLASFKGI